MITDNIKEWDKTLVKNKKLACKASKIDTTIKDLANYLGFLLGYKGESGGWIYDQNKKIICQGWLALGFLWMKKGWIKKTSTGRFFINWNLICIHEKEWNKTK